MSDDRGFIPAWRKIYEPDHWLRPTKRDPSNRRDAFLDMCQMATHQPRRVGGTGIVLQTGEFVASLRTLGGRWKWSKDRVKRFLSEPEVSTAVRTVRETPHGTVYHVVNYGTWAIPHDSERDSARDTNRDSSETAARQEQPLEPQEPTTRGGEKRKHALPDDWAPNDTHERLAIRLGLDLESEVEKFRDYELTNARKQKDWNATFRNWLRKADEMGVGRRRREEPAALRRENMQQWTPAA
jgi:hypothetical protein